MALTRIVIPSLLFSFSLVLWSFSEPQTPRVKLASSVFSEAAFANGQGTELLSLNNEKGDTVEKEQALHRFMNEATKALCSSGLVSIKFLRYQATGKEWNGRDTSAEFKKRGGFLFSVTEGKAQPDSLCLLLSQTIDNELTVLNIESKLPKAKADQTLLKKIEAKTGHPVLSAYPIKKTGENMIWAVNFQKQGDKKRSGFYLDPRAAWFDGFVTSCKESECEPLRAGGKDSISDEDFSLVSYVKWQDNEVVFLTWKAEEGENYLVFLVEGEKMIKASQGYRYWAPI